MSGQRIVLILVGAALALAGGLWVSARRIIEEPYTASVEQLSNTSIRFPAIVNAEGFSEGDLPGYHAIVWRGGRASDDALFQAQVTDVQVLDAVESLGLVPANNLTMDAWEERHDETSMAPHTQVEGPKLRVEVQLAEDEPKDIASFLKDASGTPLDLRLGGNRALIPEWKSGCVLCLYSCPGSKVGNRALTVRNFVEQPERFLANHDRLPPDGTPVWIHFVWDTDQTNTPS